METMDSKNAMDSLTLFKEIKIEHISELKFSSCIQLVFIACQVESYQNML